MMVSNSVASLSTALFSSSLKRTTVSRRTPPTTKSSVFFFTKSKSVQNRECDDVDDFVSHRDGWFCTDDDEWLCDGDGW